MPTAHALDVERRLVNSRAWGSLTEHELVAHQLAIRARFDDGSIDATWSQLVDFSEVTDMGELSSAAIARLARSNPWPKGTRRVFIASTDVVFGLVRMFHILASNESDDIRIVHSPAEAQQWLGGQG